MLSGTLLSTSNEKLLVYIVNNGKRAGAHFGCGAHFVRPSPTKSNVMVFCCNLLKDIPVPNFMLNGVPIDKVSNCKYLGHCIDEN